MAGTPGRPYEITEAAMNHAYRSAPTRILEQRCAEIAARRHLVAADLPALGAIYAARIARVAAGVVGILGAIVLVVAAGAGDKEQPVLALLVASGASIATYVALRLGLPHFTRRKLASEPLPEPTWSGDLSADLEALGARDPFEIARRRIARLETKSAALPLAAMSLLAPLTLHFFVGLAIFRSDMDEYAWWIRASLVIVGFAHLVLMGLSIRYARKLSRATFEELVHAHGASEWAKAVGFTVLAACVPGIVLILIPPVISAVTALVFVPAMFHWIRSRLIAERGLVAVAEASCAPHHVRALLGADWPMTSGADLILEAPLAPLGAASSGVADDALSIASLTRDAEIEEAVRRMKA